MRRKTFIAIIVAVMLLTAVFGLAACNNNGTATMHKITIVSLGQDISFEVADSATFDISLLTPPQGQELEGIYKDPSFTERFDPSTPIKENLTLYVKWKNSGILVQFFDKDGETLLYLEYVAKGEAANGPPEELIPVHAGWTFQGWDKTFDEINEYTKITAVYRRNVVTIRFDINGGSADGEIEAITGEYESAISAPDKTPVKPYSRFAYWYDPAQGEDVPFVFDKMPAEDITLKAHYVADKFEVKFFDRDTELIDKAFEYTYYDGDIVLQPLSAAGLKFEGWFDNAALEGQAIEKISAGSHENKTFYAKWSVLPFDFTILSDKSSFSIIYGDTLTLSADISEAEGLTYVYEWYKGSFTEKPSGAADYTTETIRITDVDQSGNYTLFVTASGKGVSFTAKASQQVTVEPADMDVSAQGYEGVFDGVGHSIAVTVTAPAGAVITYSTDNENWVSENPVFVNAGEYKVYYKVEAENYNTFSGLATVKIAKAQIVYSADAFNGSFDGIAHGVTVAVSSPDGAKIYYSTDDGASWTETAPSFVDAGSYGVKIKIEADNYVTAEETLTVNISKKQMSVETSGYNGKYDANGHSVSVAVTDPTDAIIEYSTDNGASWTQDKPSFVNVGNYEVQIRVTHRNYVTFEITQTVTISAADINVTANGWNGTFDGTGHSVSVIANPSDALIEYSIDGGNNWTGTAPSFINAGDHKVKYRVSKANYNTAEGEIAVSIAKAPLTLTVNGLTKVYDGKVWTFAFGDFKAEGNVTAVGLVAGDSLTAGAISTKSANAGVYSSADILASSDILDVEAFNTTLGIENYEITSSFSVEITKGEVTVSASASVTYGNALGEWTYVYNGFIEGENENNTSIIGLPIVEHSYTVTTAAGSYNYSVDTSALSSPNYTFKGAVAALSVERRALTVQAGNSLVEKAYDGSTAAALVSGTHYVIGNVANNDSIGIVINGVYAQANVGADIVVAVTYENTVTGEKASNYTLEAGSFTLNGKINKAVPQYTVPTGLTAYSSQTLGDISLPNGFTFEAPLTTTVGEAGINKFLVTYTPQDTANYSVVEGIEVSISVTATKLESITVGGNYKTEYTAFDLFDPSGMTVTAHYNDGSENEIENYTVEYATAAGRLQTGDAFVTIVVTSGSDRITAKALGLTVGKKQVTLSADSFDLTYGDEVPKLSYKADGLFGSDTVDGVLTSGSVSLSTDYTAASAVGNYAVTIGENGTLTADNYTFNLVNGQITVAKKNVTVTVGEQTSAVYNGEMQSVKNGEAYYSIDGLISGHTANVTLSGGGINAGVYDISVQVKVFADGEEVTANYNIEYVNNNKFEITKATLTVTPQSQTVTYNGALQSAVSGLDYVTAEGLVNGHNLTSITLSGEGKNVGSYTISASGATVSVNGDDVTANYDVKYNSASLKIEKAALTVTANDNTATYNGLVQGDNGVTTQGLQGSDSLTADVTGGGADVLQGGYVLTVTNVKIMNGDENVTANYNITTINGTLTITKRPIVITANDQSAVYNGTAQSVSSAVDNASASQVNGVAESGLVNGHGIGSITLSGGGTVAGTYDITASDASIVDASGIDVTANYDIREYVNGTFVISSIDLTIAAVEQTVTYDGTEHGSYTAPALQGGDTLSSVTLAGKLTNAGTSTLTPSEAVIMNGDGQEVTASYNITYVSAALTVEKATPVITASDAAYDYDGIAKGITAAAGIGNPDASNYINLDDHISYSGNNYIDGGTYDITISVAGSDNWNEVSKTVVLKIKSVRIGDTLYTIEDALELGGELIVENNTVLNHNATVKVGTTLILPSDVDTSGIVETDKNKATYYSKDKGAGYYVDENESMIKVKFYITDGISLTSNGNIVIRGLLGSPSQPIQGHTSGSHSQIINNGTITLQNGSATAVRGFIKGKGNVEIKDGAVVYSPFVVKDYRGGTNTVTVFKKESISPFNVYEMPNIQCDYVIYKGASYKAYVDLFASSAHNIDVKEVIGTNGIINLNSGYLRKNYTTKTTLTLVGDITMGSLTLTAMSQTVSMSECFFPIPYTYDIIIGDGITPTILKTGYKYKLLPGMSLTVSKNATLELQAGGQIIVYSEFNDMPFGNPSSIYPQKEAAKFIVNGTFVSNGDFGGEIVSNLKDATVQIGNDAGLNLYSKEGNSGATTSTQAIMGAIGIGNSWVFVKVYETTKFATFKNSDMAIAVGKTYVYDGTVWQESAA